MLSLLLILNLKGKKKQDVDQLYCKNINVTYVCVEYSNSSRFFTIHTIVYTRLVGVPSSKSTFYLKRLRSVLKSKIRRLFK